jgi:hypothetical protein
VDAIWRAVDLAELYGVDESTVHRWERAGRLRPARRDDKAQLWRAGILALYRASSHISAPMTNLLTDHVRKSLPA